MHIYFPIPFLVMEMENPSTSNSLEVSIHFRSKSSTVGLPKENLATCFLWESFPPDGNKKIFKNHLIVQSQILTQFRSACKFQHAYSLRMKKSLRGNEKEG